MISEAKTILDSGLFQQAFYERQSGTRFESAAAAVADYLGAGAGNGHAPHPLFDVPFYLGQEPDLGGTRNPLLHYLEHGWRQGLDPHPLFDGDFYAGQVTDLEGLSPLAHFLRNDAAGGSPNRLFDSRWYLTQNPDVAAAGMNTLEHYVLYGRAEARVPHERLAAIIGAWKRPDPLSLRRGEWERRGEAWVCVEGGDEGPACASALEAVAHLVESRRLDVNVAVVFDGSARRSFERLARTVCLQEFDSHLRVERGVDRFALRMLLFPLLAGSEEMAICDSSAMPELAGALAGLGVAVQDRLPAAVESASEGARRVIVPCNEWNISGVCTAIEVLGKELIDRGWDFRVLFTRGTRGVLDGACDEAALPRVPHEFLDIGLSPGRRRQWRAIIRHFERRAPCIFLSAYDDVANAVAPALTDKVGVVGWLQSDEDHYYESAYRLGRYWNGIVSVSDHIQRKVIGLNPSFETRSHLIHNATARRGEVIDERDFLDGGTIRLLYAGRFVQYQKRTLDFVPLVRALDQAAVDYRLTLIGASRAGAIENNLRRELAEQIAAGAVRLPGRLPREEVLGKMAENDAFVLLSDFEGLPLSLTEAMARGCVPVVARMDSGVPEIVSDDDTGIVVDGRDYAIWATKIAGLAADPQRLQRLSESARRLVAERFSADAMADRFESILEQILEDIRRGSYTRPPTLTWSSDFGDVLLPPPMQGRAID